VSIESTPSEKNIRNQSSGEQTDSYVLIIPFVLLLVVFGSVFLATQVRRERANDCDGRPGSPDIREVSGPITGFQSSYYIPNKGGNWILFQCSGRCSSPLKHTFKSAEGKNATARFCKGEVLSVDIEGTRVLTKDSANTTFWPGFLFGLGPLFLVFAIAWSKASRGNRKAE
jgi:hypothetical protein